MLHPYRDQAGYPTIGVGHLIKDGESFSDQITQAQAMALLATDVARFEDAVNGYGLTLTRDQFDVLVDFSFNCGEGALKQLLSHGLDDVPNQLPRWIHGGGRVIQALVNRRAAEVEKLSGGHQASEPEAPPAPSSAGFDELTGIDFPLMQKDVGDSFGKPDEKGEFAKTYLKVIDLTEFAAALSHAKDYDGNRWSCKVYGNYVLERPLRRAFRALVEKGLAHEIKTFDGCFSIRQAKSGNFSSMHSWALAVDFNAGTNPFRKSGLVTDFSDAFVQCFLDAGFEWGGLWTSPVDAMHFQLPWTRDWRTLSMALKPKPFVDNVPKAVTPTVVLPAVPEVPAATAAVPSGNYVGAISAGLKFLAGFFKRAQ